MAFTPFAAAAAVRPMRFRLERPARLLAVWCRRRRQRIDLGELDDRLLADIGVKPALARHESRKPFWR